ncbi:MAG: polyprenyl synthetase family protein [Bacteroidota bacterium]|nr:polyprenyl synthetase family protein [Bacteroidota bacterium]
MKSFKELSTIFEEKFNIRHFPRYPANLYDASQYLLTIGGKRIRPVMCLMGNELVDEIHPDAFHVAAAIEMFHNFTLIHDDIMDKAPLRRGMQTVHTKFGEPTALLSGDVMLVLAYESINKIGVEHLHDVLEIFNKTAREVCEGQQLDMDFEKEDHVSFEDYVKMIGLKTSVLLAASLQLGSVLGGAGQGNQQHLYEFGKNLGIAFQVQDDYLDAFGDPEKFGKKQGGDITSNKKTFLLIHALQAGSAAQVAELKELLRTDDSDKIPRVLDIYKACDIPNWATELKQKYMAAALEHLEEIAVLSARKKPLQELAYFLLDRQT